MVLLFDDESVFLTLGTHNVNPRETVLVYRLMHTCYAWSESRTETLPHLQHIPKMTKGYKRELSRPESHILRSEQLCELLMTLCSPSKSYQLPLWHHSQLV